MVLLAIGYYLIRLEATRVHLNETVLEKLCAVPRQDIPRVCTEMYPMFVRSKIKHGTLARQKMHDDVAEELAKL